MSKSNCNCSGGTTNSDDRVKDVPGEWFYYTDCNADDIQMIVREIKDPMFTPLAYIGSKLGFTSGSMILRRFLTLLGVTNLPVQDGSADAISGNGNFTQGIVDSPIPIQLLGDTLWGADTTLPSPADAIPLSIYPSHILLRKAILRALRTGKRFGIKLTGPATDLALDLKANEDLDLGNAIIGIKNFGGAVAVAGNLFTVPGNKLAEFNIYLDPQAFVDVLTITKRHNIPVNMVSLDCTNTCPITREYFNSSLQPSTFVTIEGKAMGNFFNNVRLAFTDPVFFNDANVPGGGYYQWDPSISRSDEITSWECGYYNVETTPLVSYSGWIHRSNPTDGFPIRVAFSQDCNLFRTRWKAFFDKPFVYNGQFPSIANEPLTLHPCKSSGKKDCCKDCRGH